jgi:molybdopterin converting factor subunit 1
MDPKTGKVRVTVRLFAVARERAGSPELELDLPGAPTVADIRAALRARLPALGPLWATALIAVDEEYAGEEAPIAAGARLAVIPPVSGGAPAGLRTGSRRRHSRGINHR